MLFSALEDDLQQALLASAPCQAFAKDQIIQQRGEVADGFWVISSGSIAVGLFLPDGDFRAVALLGPGDSWGELALFAGRPRVVDAVSRTRSSLHFIRAGIFERAIEGRPAAMRPLLGVLSEQLQDTLDLMAGIRSGSGKSRVAALLATMARDARTSAEIAISQHELGELLGLTRATVNAALKGLEAQGLVRRNYGSVTVLEPELLERAGLD